MDHRGLIGRKAAGRASFPSVTAWLIAGLGLLISAAPCLAQLDQIEGFELHGNEFVSMEAFLALTDLEVGDRFDEQAIQAEFWKIWDTGLFEDVRIEAEDGPKGGLILIFTVREKPRVDSVTYEKVDAFDQDRLEEVLTQENALISIGTALDEKKVADTTKIIEELMASEGHPDAEVSSETRHVAASRVAVDFQIKPGAKVKVDEIRFVGNTIFGDKHLKKLLENTQEKWLGSFLSDKTTFYRPRLDSDLQAVRNAYRSKGYLDIQVGQAKIVSEKLKPGKKEKLDKRFVVLEIPVIEGKPYRLGNLTLDGASVFPTSDLRSLIPLGEGELLNVSLLELGLNRIDNRYGDDGYLYASSSWVPTKNQEAHVADVAIQVVENQRYKIRQIEFVGNPRTRDEVLRREMRLHEGDTFSRRDYQLSMRKIAQLGYWELAGEGAIRPVEDSAEGEPQVDVTIAGKEVGRNEIQFGGGFSGLDGFFGTFSFQSRNFLGRGSQLSVSGQLGGTATTYNLSYVEPYAFKTRGSLGASVFLQDRDYTGFDQESKGGSIFWAYPTSTFSSFRLTGSWDESELRNTTSDDGDTYTTFSVSPSFRFDTRDNPFRPTRGRIGSATLKLGWASGEDDPDLPHESVTFIRPRFEFTQRYRTLHKQYLALHFEGGLLAPLSGSEIDRLSNDGIDTPYIPVFERNFLGGEQSIRGVETRSVGPRVTQFRNLAPGVPLTQAQCQGVGGELRAGIALDGTSLPEECYQLRQEEAIGGDAYYLFNMEYSVPLSDIFEVAAFMDVGNSFGVDHMDIRDLVDARDLDILEIQDSSPLDMKGTAGFELRFHTPVLQQPLRLIYGCKVFGDFIDDEQSCDFQFSIGRTFQ